MKAAFVRVDITPLVGLPIGGNVRADSAARGTHDPLYGTGLVLEDGGTTACLLSLDVLGLHRASCRSLRNAVAAASGIPADHVAVAATHTHSGPDVVDFFKEAIDPRCLAYLDDVGVRIAEAVREGRERLEEATFALGEARVEGLSFNRRLRLRGGGLVMNWERPDPADVVGPEGPVDPQLLALAVRGRDGRPLGVVANFALHPAILVGEGWRWSRDYVYYLEKAIGLGLGQAVPVLFLNGAEGNVNHLAPDASVRATGFAEAERVGAALGARVLEALAAARTLPPGRLAVRTEAVRVPRRVLAPDEVAAAEALLSANGGAPPSLVDGVPDEVFAAQVLKLARLEERTAETDLAAIALADAFALATLPGEAFVEFGLRIKAESPYAATMVAGLADDCIGYIPTPAAFAAGGYEPRTASSSQLAPEAGPQLAEHALRLLRAVRADAATGGAPGGA